MSSEVPQISPPTPICSHGALCVPVCNIPHLHSQGRQFQVRTEAGQLTNEWADGDLRPWQHMPLVKTFSSRLKWAPATTRICSSNLSGRRAMGWRRQWHPTPVLLPGKSHGWRSLEGCSPWGCWRSDTTERLHFHFSLSCIGEGNGNPLQCSCLENPRNGGAWWAAIYGVAQGRTRLKWLSSSSSRAMGKANVKPYSKSQGMNFIEQICKQAQPKQVHQPTFSHHPSHSLQGEGGACGHKVSAAGGTLRAALLLVYLLCLKSCIFFLILFYF